MIGRLVLEQDLRSPLSTIDISQLSNGVYNYSITKQGQKVYTGKIIKE
ncbi:MAG: T9SS type A sorting domain-containing protein [Bacteroidota bacterium]|nr:MAG: T9SS type A sorting domain-containing protein [Bacteroidota bacterium]